LQYILDLSKVRFTYILR